MTDPRPGWSQYFLGVADAVPARGDCTRRQVGFVLVDPETKDIIETGYNGAPKGMPGCLSAGACPRGRHYQEASMVYEDGFCACGNTWPCDEAVAPGSSYDTGPGTCLALHAEQNGCIRAGRRARGAWGYCTDSPCDGCLKLMRGAGVVRVVWPDGSLDL